MKPQEFTNITFRPIYIETAQGCFYGLFSDYRVDNSTVPVGLTPYEIRHGDDDSQPCTIEPSVLVNFYGTIIVARTLTLNPDRYIQITGWGFEEWNEQNHPQWINEYYAFKGTQTKLK